MPCLRQNVKRLKWALMLCALGVCLAAKSASAQQFSVQEPTFETFSGATTVSVPDRGRMLIGGVGQGQSGRSTYGPIPSGTNYGSSFSGSSMTVGVRIHDFAEMDRQLLGEDSATVSGSGRKFSENSDHAYRVLLSRSNAARRANGDELPRDAVASATVPESVPDGIKADQFFQKGQRAAERGQKEVALVYFRLAKKHGSSAATAELSRLGSEQGIARAAR